MLRNHLLVAWRNIFRNKTFSTINILGLALGIACSILILLWVRDERGIDAFHANKDLLFQVYERYHADGRRDATYTTQGLLAIELKRNIPAIEFAAGYEYAAAPGSQNTFAANNRIAKFNGSYAGDDFFKMFSFRIIAGDRESTLRDPGAVAISRQMASVFFSSPEEALGKSLLFDNKESLLVKAVFEDVNDNSTLQFDFIRSWSAFVRDNAWVNNWGNTSPATYVQLKAGANAATVNSQIKDFIDRYQARPENFRTELAIQPFHEKYLHSNFVNGEISGGRIVYLRLFNVIAAFILIIACINFMNLATARAADRAREIGVRKVMGADRFLLFKQFIGEALMLTFISSIAALIIVFLLIPSFNQLTGKHIQVPLVEPAFLSMLLAIIVITGFLAGSYPALFMSSLKPVKVLKSQLKFGAGAVFFRKSLVIFQFTLSIILIVAVIVVYRQVDFIRNKNLGYDRFNLVYLPIEGDLAKNYEVFKQESLKTSGVVSVSKMRNSPTVIEHHTGSIEWPGKDSTVNIPFADAVVGYDFAQTMKLEFIAGRDFDRNYGRDSAAFIINETAAKRMEFDAPVGQTIKWGNRPGTIIGVLKDFHFSSMHQSIEPLIIRLDEKWNWGTILVRVNARQTHDALAGLEKICADLNPKFPFTYQFSDEEFARLYRSEEMVSQLSRYFAILAIFISCLGLFGLAAFSASQRKKEVGVRKVLGATTGHIAAMLSASFLKPVLLAIIFAVPVSQFVMSRWLENFAYHPSLEWWVFVMAAILAILIALITVAAQAIRAATVNPVQSLRSE